jgi:protein HOOK2
MTTVLDRLAVVDDGNRAVARLDERSAELDAQITRVEARVQFVEKLEQRVNGLHVLTAEVERKLADQLTRRAEVEGVKNLCDTLLTQVVDAQQKLDGVAALQGRVMPMVTQVGTLMQTLEKSQQLVQSLKIDEAQVQQQRAQFAELTEQGKALAAETAERLKQVRGVSDDLGRAATLKEELHAELARVQATQRDAIAQTEAAEEQMRRADAMARQAQQHCTQVLHGEEKVTALEGRLADLDRSADAVEQKIHALGDQEVLVQAVKAEVENIRQISSRSKADLQFVSEHRNDVSELRDKVEDLLERVRDTDGKIELIESRRRMVEEVQARANSIAHMLEDIQVNLEMLGEQRAVVDHVGEKLARLDFTLQEAHNTLRALQREREVAERIEQGIKALRSTRNGAASDTAAVGS